MNEPITITEVVGRAVQGMTRPFLCKAGFFDYYVKGSYAGLNSLCYEWGENIDPSPPVGYAGTRHRTFNIERRSEELAKLVGRLRDATPGQGARERVEETRGGTPRARPAAGRHSHVVEWLHVDGDESLPVQLDMKRVISALELPFTDPDTFWKLP